LNEGIGISAVEIGVPFYYFTPAIALRQISVQDYHRMAESGILRSDERVEQGNRMKILESLTGKRFKIQ